MGELLQKILSLRENINILSKFSNDKSYEYCELAIKITDTEEEIENMKVTKENLEESIMDFKLKKVYYLLGLSERLFLLCFLHT